MSSSGRRFETGLALPGRADSSVRCLNGSLSISRRLCHAAPFVGLAPIAASPGFPTGRAGRRVQYLTRAVDDCSWNRTPTLAQLQPMSGSSPLSQQRQDQGQCQRPAHRCLADLSMRGLRWHLEPSHRRGRRARPPLPVIASGERPRSGRWSRLRRRGAEALDRSGAGIRGRRGQQVHALGERAARSAVGDRVPGTSTDGPAHRSPPGERAAAVTKFDPETREGGSTPHGSTRFRPPPIAARRLATDHRRDVPSGEQPGSSYPSRNNGTAAAASSTAAMRVFVNGSFNQSTAITTAKTALVSRSAAAGAIGAWPHTQRIRR